MENCFNWSILFFFQAWEINTGKLILDIEGHGNQDIRCCDVSSNDKLLASASADKTVRVSKIE